MKVTSGFKNLTEDDSDFEDGVISLSADQTLSSKGVRYRQFVNKNQDSIYHMLFDQRDCRKRRFKGDLYVECRPHLCHLHCEDSGGLICDGTACNGIHDNLFFQDEKGLYHLDNNDHPDVIFVGLKFKKQYYRKWSNIE